MLDFLIPLIYWGHNVSIVIDFSVKAKHQQLTTLPQVSLFNAIVR